MDGLSWNKTAFLLPPSPAALSSTNQGQVEETRFPLPRVSGRRKKRVSEYVSEREGEEHERPTPLPPPDTRSGASLAFRPLVRGSRVRRSQPPPSNKTCWTIRFGSQKRCKKGNDSSRSLSPLRPLRSLTYSLRRAPPLPSPHRSARSRRLPSCRRKRRS